PTATFRRLPPSRLPSVRSPSPSSSFYVPSCSKVDASPQFFLPIRCQLKPSTQAVPPSDRHASLRPRKQPSIVVSVCASSSPLPVEFQNSMPYTHH
uniref:Uncharacterized protein n=1 Tax=Cucumis melo TaxID=3656 RepID=A0A9I9DY53_CUCME